MRIARTLAGDLDCPQGFDCPHIHETEGGELVVQGYAVTDTRTLAELRLASNQIAVRLPTWMPREHHVDITRFQGDWAIVVGEPVTDSEMLDQMGMDRRPDEAVIYPAREEVLL